ncbi:MAG TPA: glycosyltransferase family 4 protein [Jatrophihabitantaceae bacterium]|jgi:glycosyltransferase involved in cell wall biosynthesis
MPADRAARRVRTIFLVWRDTRHPDGGGSELYVERMASWLAANGHDVTIVCAAHPNAPRDEIREGVRFRRRGGRLTVYARALAFLLTRAGRRADVVVDVQNGIPFFSALVRRRPVFVLVHHVHREQWQIIYPGWPGRVGWWLESRVAPRVYRRCPYVTVSDATVSDLAELGVAPTRIRVVRNGIDLPQPSGGGPRSARPTVCVLSRLVPHKQIEHALQAMARLQSRLPGLRLEVIGDGWWRPNLEEHARQLGVADIVRFHGHVDNRTRDAVLNRAWVLLAPSVKEGWGIAIVEAAAHGLPAVAYLSGGGVRESILNGETGLLADGFDDLVAATARLLTDDQLRTRMGEAARQRATEFDWPSSAAKLRELLEVEIEWDQRLP